MFATYRFGANAESQEHEQAVSISSQITKKNRMQDRRVSVMSKTYYGMDLNANMLNLTYKATQLNQMRQ